MNIGDCEHHEEDHDEEDHDYTAIDDEEEDVAVLGDIDSALLCS